MQDVYLVPEWFFHLCQELIFFSATYIYIHSIAHYYDAALTTNIFFSMKKIYEKGFMNAKKNSAGQQLLIIKKSFGNSDFFIINQMENCIISLGFTEDYFLKL